VSRLAVQVFVALFLFGCIPVVVRWVHANPYTIGIVRLAIASLGVAAIMAVRGQFRRLPPRDVARLAIIGVIFFGHLLTFFLAIKASSASIGAIGLSTYGVDLLLLSAFVSRTRPRVTDLVAVTAAATGAILVVPSFDVRDEVFVGMLLACGSALLYASLPLLHQRWSHIPTSLRAFGQFFFALIGFSLFLGKANWDLGARDWAALLFLAIGVTLIGHTLWIRVTTSLSPATTSVLYYGNIPIAIALSVLLLGEPLTVRVLCGAGLIVGGSVFGLLSRRETLTSVATLPREDGASANHSEAS
jgi:drug/metabolite transporter (DMT)-like permease